MLTATKLSSSGCNRAYSTITNIWSNGTPSHPTLGSGGGGGGVWSQQIRGTIFRTHPPLLYYRICLPHGGGGLYAVSQLLDPLKSLTLTHYPSTAMNCMTPLFFKLIFSPVSSCWKQHILLHIYCCLKGAGVVLLQENCLCCVAATENIL